MSACPGFKAAVVAIIACASLGITISQASAQDYWRLSCGELWQRRNEIYARNGYCFKTPRAIRAFGNDGCRFDFEADVPMSQYDRREIDGIKIVERRKGCGTY